MFNWLSPFCTMDNYTQACSERVLIVPYQGNCTEEFDYLSYGRNDTISCAPEVEVAVLHFVAALVGARLQLVNASFLAESDGEDASERMLLDGRAHLMGPNSALSNSRLGLGLTLLPLEFDQLGYIVSNTASESVVALPVLSFTSGETLLTFICCVVVTYFIRKVIVSRIGDRGFLAAGVKKILHVPLLIFGLFTVILVNMYSNELSITLVKRLPPQLPFRSMNELKQLMRHHGWILLYDEGKMEEELIKTNIGPDLNTFVQSVSFDDAIAAVLTTPKIAFLTFRSSFLASNYSQCQYILFISDPSLPSAPYGFLVSPKMPPRLEELFSYSNLALVKKHYEYLQHKDRTATWPTCTVDSSAPLWRPITFRRSEVVFQPWLIGLAASFACIVCEIVLDLVWSHTAVGALGHVQS